MFAINLKTTPEELKQDGAHEPECKHIQKATYVQMTLL